jgi:hypothetical protein
MRCLALLLVIVSLVGCSGKPEATPAPVPQPIAASLPPPPPPAFNPNDRHATFVWFLDAHRRLAEDRRIANEATINPLVEEPMEKFAEKVRAYKKTLPQLRGQRIHWPAQVESIDKKGVKVRCYESEYSDPYSTSPRSDRFVLDVFVNGEESHFDQYGHSRHEEEYTLVLDKQIPLEFAKTLRFGDKVMLSGTIASVYATYYGKQDDKLLPNNIDIFLTDVSAGPIKE